MKDELINISDENANPNVVNMLNVDSIRVDVEIPNVWVNIAVVFH